MILLLCLEILVFVLGLILVSFWLSFLIFCLCFWSCFCKIMMDLCRVWGEIFFGIFNFLVVEVLIWVGNFVLLIDDLVV